jgi:hypothetical protein
MLWGVLAHRSPCHPQGAKSLWVNGLMESTRFDLVFYIPSLGTGADITPSPALQSILFVGPQCMRGNTLKHMYLTLPGRIHAANLPGSACRACPPALSSRDAELDLWVSLITLRAVVTIGEISRWLEKAEQSKVGFGGVLKN